MVGCHVDGLICITICCSRVFRFFFLGFDCVAICKAISKPFKVSLQRLFSEIGGGSKGAEDPG